MSPQSSPENPVLRGMYPDPSICRVGDTYYLVTSTFEYLPGIPVHASTDLVNWQLLGHAIHDPAQFDFSVVPDSRGIFAPTIRYHEGTFYIVCTQMDAGADSGSFYLTATDSAGPWSFPVFVRDAVGIDPSLFFHDGRVWWTGCREVADPTFDGETEVWLRELDLETGALVGEERVIWTRTQYRAVWAEAPHLYERNGWFYLVTAEGGTSFEHSVMVARSREVTGPFLPCPSNPVLTHRHLGHEVETQNVGHADLVEGDDGQWWMVVLATRPLEGHHILGRETNLARVTWYDDWPVVNAGLGMLDAPVDRAYRAGSTGVPDVSDFLSVRGFPSFASSEQGGVRLRSLGEPGERPGPVAALLRRVSSTQGSLTITLDELEAETAAGLVVRQSSDVQVRAEVTSAGERVRLELIARNGDDSVVGSAELPAHPVTLRADLSRDGISWSAHSAGGVSVELGNTPLSAVSTETAGGFVGTTFGPYVTGPQGASVLFTDWSQEDRC